MTLEREPKYKFGSKDKDKGALSHYGFPLPVLVNEEVFGAVDLDKHGNYVLHALGAHWVQNIGIHWLWLPVLQLMQCKRIILLFFIIVFLHGSSYHAPANSRVGSYAKFRLLQYNENTMGSDPRLRLRIESEMLVM